MMRQALRMAAGTASLAAGGWLLRALHGAPAALGADPAAIEAAAKGSPNYRDGVFVNIDPGSLYVMDREQLRQIAWELVGGRSSVPSENSRTWADSRSRSMSGTSFTGPSAATRSSSSGVATNIALMPLPPALPPRPTPRPEAAALPLAVCASS